MMCSYFSFCTILLIGEAPSCCRYSCLLFMLWIRLDYPQLKSLEQTKLKFNLKLSMKTNIAGASNKHVF